jgi:hypothetical protein
MTNWVNGKLLALAKWYIKRFGVNAVTFTVTLSDGNKRLIRQEIVEVFNRVLAE